MLVSMLANWSHGDSLESFDDGACANTLMVPFIRRLLEQRGGTLTASAHDAALLVASP